MDLRILTRRTLSATLAGTFLCLQRVDAADPLLHGFSDRAAAAERRVEASFLSIPSAQGALEHAKVLGAQPHPPGSGADRDLARYVHDRLAGYGFESTIDSTRAPLESPAKIVLETGPPHAFSFGKRIGTRRKSVTSFDLYDETIASDPDTGRDDAGLPFAYGSADGDVAAPLVFVNRGLDSDYATLAAAKIEIAGKIVLIRAGGQKEWKTAERAQRFGASGILYYHDPKDDGSAVGAAYPNGPWRPDGAVTRIRVSDGGSLHIPAMPISAKTAAILLTKLKGRPAPANWTGGIAVPYMFGPSDDLVHLNVHLTRKNGNIWNNVGTLVGRRSDQFIVIGAYRDAPAFGASANGSGVVTLLELARGLGYLYENGWRPERTIVLAAWDGKEYGELGSRAFAMQHLNELRRGCIAYLNADSDVTGPYFSASAAAALRDVILSATRAVNAPDNGATLLYDRWLHDQRRFEPRRSRPAFDWPGTGSDIDAFLYQLGIPVADLGFRGPFGVANSIYDDLNYAQTQADPGFLRHRTAAQIFGVVALRLADATTIPYDFNAYSDSLHAALGLLQLHLFRSGTSLNINDLRRAVVRFSGASFVYEAAPPTESPVADQRALDVAHVLDAALYGTGETDSTVFPAIGDALERHGDAAGAVRSTAHAVDKATSMLGEGKLTVR